jgi:hypothetical protein
MSVLRRARRRAGLCAALFGVLQGCGGSSAAPTQVVPTTPPLPHLPELTSMSVVAPADSIAAGQAITLGVAPLDDQARPMTVGLVTWSSTNPAVARVGFDGVLLCLAPGTTTISATVGAVTGKRVITITPQPPGPLPVTSVQVSPYATTLEIGQAQAMKVALRNFAGDTLTGRAVAWTTSNDSIVIVSADGVVTARAPGVAIVEATSETQRGAVQVTVRVPVDTSIVVAVPYPVAGAILGDTITVIASVHAFFPVESVGVLVGSIPLKMELKPVGALGAGLAWAAYADISTLPFGANSIVVTAIDSRGKRGVFVVPFFHDPKTNGGGGGKSAGGSK